MRQAGPRRPPGQLTTENTPSEDAKGKQAPAQQVQATDTSATVEAGKPASNPVADMRAKAAAEQERIAAVRKVCGDANAEIAAKAIGQGWDVTRTELEVLRADRPKAPASHVPDSSTTGSVLEAACMITGGVKGDAVLATYGEQALDAADKRFRGGIGLQDLLLEAAWANGYEGRNFRDSRAVLRFAFRPDVQAAGFSTIDTVTPSGDSRPASRSSDPPRAVGISQSPPV